MKKTMLIGMALGIVALTASTSFATIVGSMHDLSTENAGDFTLAGENRICVFCHTPHNAIKAGSSAANANGVTGTTKLAYSPLWNRAYTKAWNYTLYNNGTGGTDTNGYLNPMVIDNDSGTTGSVNRHMMNGTPAMSGISLLCMSCHDGVTAVNAFSGNGGVGGESGMGPNGHSGIESEWATSRGNGTKAMDSVRVIGRSGVGVGRAPAGDLSNHHPIGMSWTDSEKDPEINPRTTAFRANLTIEDVLQGGDIMTCASCHDVHNADGNYKFLHRDNFTQSAFCLTCHKK
jgi:predicted CXXCH cytochrome family protein